MLDQVSEGASLELGRYWRVVRRRWFVVVAFILLCGALGGLYGLIAQSEYTATTLVNLNVVADTPFSTQRSASGLIDPATEAQLARSSSVLRAAATALGANTTIADVRRATTVTVLPEATVARVTYTAPRMADAIAGADSVGQAYVDYRTREAQAKVDRITKKLDKRQASVTKELTAANKALSGNPSAAQRAAAISQRQLLQSQLSAVLSQLNSVASIDTSGGHVITNAGDNPLSVAPHTRLLSEMGVALGFVLGLLAAFVVDALDRRVVCAADVSKCHGGRLLAMLDDKSGSVPALGRDEEGYRVSAEQLLALGPEGRRSFAIIDLTRRTQPVVAANLALALASASGDAVTGLFPTPAAPTADLLVAECDGRVVTVPARSVLGGSAVRVGPADDNGSHQANGPDSSGGSGTPSGTLLIAVPPGAPRSSALAAVRQAESVVLVLERKHTRRRDVGTLIDDLAAVGGHVAGSILAPVVPRDERAKARVARRQQRRAPIPASDGV